MVAPGGAQQITGFRFDACVVVVAFIGRPILEIHCAR